MRKLSLLLSCALLLSISQLPAQTTLNITANDYAEEIDSSGAICIGSSDLELAYDGANQTVGIYFDSVNIPQGRTITSAYIQFTADESQSGTNFTLRIKAEDADNGSLFSNSSYNVSSRSVTSDSVIWNPAAWNIGDAGAAQQTPSLVSVIQDVVDRQGWNQNSLVIVISADQGSNSDHRTAETNPVLHIEYSGSPSPFNRNDYMYYVSDVGDRLYKVNVTNGICSNIGATGVSNIEAIANWPEHLGNKLYAANGGDLGTINTSTGVYTIIGEIDGGGTADGSEGPQNLDDVDGLAFDPKTGILWGNTRREGNYDLLFQIDPATGLFIPDAFGSNYDYFVIQGSDINYDIDDLAISPITGIMYGLNNNSGSNDQIVKINKLTGACEVSTVFSSLSDVEGCDFSCDGTFYVSQGNGNSLSTANYSNGSSTFVNSNLDGGGDVEALATLVEEVNTMEGKLWQDDDNDGILDASETTTIAGVTVSLYLDVNADGVLDDDDTYLCDKTTNSSGEWSFEYAYTGHLIATVKVSSLPTGYVMTSTNIHTVNFTTSGQTSSNNDFGANTGVDCDNDGIPDFSEGVADTDGDGVLDKCDPDADNDGILDSEEGIDDNDGDGIPNYLDLDSDNDGIPDAIEANGGVEPTDYSSSTARIGGADTDGDGLMDAIDAGSTSKLENYDTDNDLVKDYLDLDSDNDGILDLVEAGGTDSDGDGVVDSFTDSDSDGFNDSFTSNPLPIPNTDSATEAVSLPNYRDIDSDGDSIDDSREGFSAADYKVPTIINDCDGDGILDIYDKSTDGTSITPVDYDGDGTPDYLDLDSDDDTGSDMVEGNDANSDGVADSSPLNADVDKNGLDDAFDKDCHATYNNVVFNIDERSEEDLTDGSIELAANSSDIELTYEYEPQIVGLRYANITINKGTKIASAYIQFKVDEVGSGDITLLIRADAADNSAALSYTTSDISTRTKTYAKAVWSPDAWVVVGDEGASQRTVDISSVIQEVIDRSGWVSGNAITIIISSDETDLDARVAENDPTLSIKYETTAKGNDVCYNCGSDIALQDEDADGPDGKQDWRDVDATTPVSLIEFNASIVNDYVEINWTTASEENSDIFIVQKSLDNENFVNISQQKAAGNSNTLVNYHSYDYNINEGVMYYRLKQIDFDGAIFISPVVKVRNISDNGIHIFPNPSNGNIIVETKEDVDVTVYTISGQELANYRFQANTINTIDITNQPKGIYFLSYITNNKRVIKKLIVR